MLLKVYIEICYFDFLFSNEILLFITFVTLEFIFVGLCFSLSLSLHTRARARVCMYV